MGKDNRQKLVWVVDRDDESDDPAGWLDYAYDDDDDVQTPDYAKLTIEEIADFMDGKAESRNNHGFTGTHRILAALLAKEVGKEKAKEILWKIAGMGGLDAMTGLYNGDGFPPAYNQLGVPEAWKDWKLP